MTQDGDPRGQLQRVDAVNRRRLGFTVNGDHLDALNGDTVLTAILMHGRHLRRFEFGGEPRAGFCLIGACQDCWVRRADGHPVRACTTLVEPGMALVSEPHDGC